MKASHGGMGQASKLVPLWFKHKPRCVTVWECLLGGEVLPSQPPIQRQRCQPAILFQELVTVHMWPLEFCNYIQFQVVIQGAGLVLWLLYRFAPRTNASWRLTIEQVGLDPWSHQNDKWVQIKWCLLPTFELPLNLGKLFHLFLSSYKEE